MPPWIGAPFPRVSTIRQGATPMKGRGFVSERAEAPFELLGDDQVTGADQLGMRSDLADCALRREGAAPSRRLVSAMTASFFDEEVCFLAAFSIEDASTSSKAGALAEWLSFHARILSLA